MQSTVLHYRILPKKNLYKVGTKWQFILLCSPPLPFRPLPPRPRTPDQAVSLSLVRDTQYNRELKAEVPIERQPWGIRLILLNHEATILRIVLIL